MNLPENILIKLQEGDIQAFKKIFHVYSSRLEHFAAAYVVDKDEASDIVQNVFMVLWERKLLLAPDTNLTNYLITLTKNQCLNYLKHIKVRQSFANYQVTNYRELELNYFALEKLQEDKLIFDELSLIIQKAMDSLPEQCREIFLMSRNEGLKYQEIADKLSISVKTVEKKMSISLAIFREALKDYYSLLLLLMLKH